MAQGTFLDRIVPATRARLAGRMARVPLAGLRAQAATMPPALDFAAALRPLDGGLRAIAEIKRASPSKGVLRADVNVFELANSYVRGGAAAISVLTEEDFFQGSLDDLRIATGAVAPRGIPVLRKDFVTDPYQIVEARASGADSVLLIAALLDDLTLAAFIAEARSLGMEPLVEVHDAEETRRAVWLGARIIGVNARDLRTFAVDASLLGRLRPLIPADRIVVAESGLHTMNDVVRSRSAGAQAILVGEALMRSSSLGGALHRLICLPPALLAVPRRDGMVVKLCGMRTPADALAAHDAGADLIGMVFAPGKRQVSIETARAIVAALPPDALTVGVFVAEREGDLAAIAETIAATGVRIAQICTPTSVFHCDGIPVPVIESGPSLWKHPSYAIVSGRALPLIDSVAAGEWGGTGKAGDWEAAAEAARAYPILLAGGLTPATVGEAIRMVRPWGVDVSSGIEGPDGQKDPARMRAFVQAARE